MAIVGNFDTAEEAVARRSKHWFSDVPTDGGGFTRLESRAAAPSGPRRPADVVEYDAVESADAVPRVGQRAARPPTRTSPRWTCVSWILSGGRGTRLDDALYYEKPLTSEIYAYTSNGDLTGELYVVAASEKTKPKKLNALLRAGVADLVENPPTQAEIDRARNAIRADWLVSAEYYENKAELLVDCYRDSGKADCMTDVWAKYAAVTSADLVRVTQKYLLDAEPFTLTNVPRGDGKSALPGAVTVELP
jgi:predicted Zn-dependent peptidase